MAKSGSIGQAQIVTMHNLIDLCKNISPEISVCIRGRHAVGKSESVEQIAAQIYDDFYKSESNCAQMVETLKSEPHIVSTLKAHNSSVWRHEFGIPVIMRRLSQLTEGDITGLPVLGGRGTTFKPCDWLLNACEFPCVLFLDERNRALDGVKQAVFQLTDSKAFYGHRLHEGTRVTIAENVGDNYMVQPCDPAEVSRCATVELDPTVEEWLKYSKSKNIHEYVLDFIAQNHNALEHTGDFEPNVKYPDRRSWFKFAQEAARQNLFEKPETRQFAILAGSMIGVTISSAFVTFCKNIERNVTPQEVLTNWSKAKKKLGGNCSAERLLALATKLSEHLEKENTVITDAQADQIKEFFIDLLPEHKLLFFNSIQVNTKNLIKIHYKIKDELLTAATLQQPEAPKVPNVRGKK